MGGLHDPRFEHAACGLGALVRLDGSGDHELVERALLALANLEHRGATGADPETGDGAGILTALPDRLLRDVFAAERLGELPRAGRTTRSAWCSCRATPTARLRCEELCVRICAEEGHRALGWRDVPVRPDGDRPGGAGVGAGHRGSCSSSAAGGDAGRLRAHALRDPPAGRAGGGRGRRARGRVHLRQPVVAADRLQGAAARPASSAAYYPELCATPRYTSPLALVHSRFSTNTLGTWDLAHPFGFLAHNGEINTVRGNGNWLSAREPQLLQRAVRPRPAEAVPDRRRALVGLGQAGRRGRAAGARRPVAAPRAGRCWCRRRGPIPTPRPAGRRCARSTSTTPPWSSRGTGRPRWSPATGVRVVAALDRNGLRPLRFVRSRDGLAVIASEVGVPDADRADVVESGRIGPGGMLVARPGARPRRAATSETQAAAWRARRPYRALAERAPGAARGRSAAAEPPPLDADAAAPAGCARSATPRRSSR